MRRTYNGADTADGPMGVGWTFEYNASLAEDPVTGDVTFRDPTGGQAVFRKQPGGDYLGDPGVTGRLVELSGGGWTLTGSSGEVLTFGPAGRETSDLDAGGHGVTLGYTGTNPTSLTDAAGNTTTLTYGTSGAATGKMTVVTTPDGRTVGYAYSTVNGGSRLTGVTDPSNRTTHLSYDASTGRLTGITSPASHVNAQNVYDPTTGRITAQTDAAGNTTHFKWRPSTDPGAPTGTGTETTTDPLNHTTRDVYYGNVLITHNDGLGHATQYFYDANLNLVGVQDPRGYVTTMTYDTAGNRLTRTAPAPLSTVESWTYDANNNVTSHTNGRGKTTSYTYNAANQMLTSTDPLSRVTHYTYTTSGRLATKQTPAARTTQYGYDSNGNLTSITSPGGHVTSYTRSAAGRVTAETSPRGNVTGATAEDYTTHYTYDDDGQPLTVTDPADTVTTNTYDDDGNLLEAITTDPSTTPATVLSDVSHTYDPNDRILTTTDYAGTPDARTTETDTYDAAGNRLSSTDATGAEATYAYDAADQRITMTSPRGNATGATAADYTTHYTYDENGNLTDSIAPGNYDTSTQYDAVNRSVAEKTPNGEQTTTTYDADGNTTKVTDPLGNDTTWTYDDADQAVGTALSGRPATTFAYGADGNRTTETSPSGTSTTTWTYTNDGQVQTQVDPNGNVTGGTPANYTTTNGYDADGNLTSSTDQLGRATTYTYDRSGNQTSKTTPRSQTTSWTYDRLNRLTGVVPPGSLGGDTDYTYDKYGDMVTLTDDAGHTKTYAYNARHQVTKITDQLSRQRTYAYDADGDLTSWVTARGTATGATASDWTVNQTFDGRGLLTARTTSNTGVNAGTNTNFYYDPDGRLGYFQDNSGYNYLYYDADSRLTSTSGAQGNYAYTYNADSQVTKRTYPASGDITYGYNNDGLQTSLTADGNTTNFGYDASQQLTTLTYPTSVGLVQTRTYDQVGQVSSVQNKKTSATSPISRFDYTRDLTDNPTRVKTTRGTTVTNESFAYNQKDGLLKDCPGITVCGSSASNYIAYTYAASGNGHRSVETRVGVPNPGTNTYTYDAADELTKKVAAPTGGTTSTTNYTYTADGQPNSDSRTWNVLGQLASSNLSGPGAATYAYDGLGNRRAVTTSGGTKKLSWDINNPMAMLGVVTDTSNNTTAQRYDPQGDTLQSQHPNGTYPSSYYTPDALGTITDVLEGNGTPAWNYTYEPFGATISANSLVTGAVNTNFGYTGAYQETALGNQYALRARDYDPALGRFASTDAAAPALTSAYTSPYVYANNQPTALIDPTGLFSIKGIIVGAVATAAVVGIAACIIAEPCGLAAGGAATVGAIATEATVDAATIAAESATVAAEETAVDATVAELPTLSPTEALNVEEPTLPDLGEIQEPKTSVDTESLGTNCPNSSSAGNEGVGGHTSLTRASSAGRSASDFEHGYSPADFPGGPGSEYPDGRAYFGVNDSSIAEEYAHLGSYDPNVIETRIPNDVFEQEFKQHVSSLDGGPHQQIGVPRDLIPRLNEFPRFWLGSE